jgi:2-methylisocitrate lyase-like PEP mutase family enzyme
MMAVKTRQLRGLLESGEFLYMPSAATPLEGRLAETMGCKAVYTGGYVTGASRAISEPLLTMDEQVRVAGEVARACTVPLVADAGAGFGEPLHTMRTVREFAAAGVAGIHIEDQLYPKRAHYHTYVVHAIPVAVPLVWVQSRGNRDGRPILSLGELQQMGYRACIDAQILLLVSIAAQKQVLAEILATGDCASLGAADATCLRKEIEDLIGLAT